jgi:hypothetical protein
MTNDNGLYDEMRYLRPQLDRFRSDPLALDEGTAERLLAGGLDPADAPPAYWRTAAVLAAVAAPPSPDELAGEAQAVAALGAVARSIPHRAARRRPTVLTKVLSVKVATAAAVALLSLAGVAGAATGTLPDPAQRAAHRMLGAAGVPSPNDHASAHGTDPTARGSGSADHSPTGPDATGAAKDGLCRAWQAGQGGEHGKKDDATAFKALATAAGGADKIAAYCAGTSTANGHGQASPPSTVPAQGQAHADNHGAGNGQSQATDPAGHGQGTTPPAPRADPHG